jgi:hypothetical protein
MKELLTPEQIVTYDALRGYAGHEQRRRHPH